MSKKCSIILGGGGAKGSFQIGVLEEILNQNYEIECVFGTSIGAFNGAFVASNQFEFLKTTWLNFNKNTNFIARPYYINNNFGAMLSILFKSSLYNPNHIWKFLNKNLDTKALKESNTVYGCTIVDVEKYKLENIILKEQEEKNYSLLIQTSMAFAPGHPMNNINGKWYMDGGAIDTIPVESSIPYTTNSDTIFIITCNPIDRKLAKDYKPGVINDLIYLFWEILWYELARNDINIGKLKYWKDKKFVLIQPDFQLLETPEFDSSEKIHKMYNHGLKKGSEVFN